MLRDLLLRLLGLEQHVAAANAPEEVSTYAQLVDMMPRIVTHNRLRDGSLINDTCVLGTDTV